MQWEHSKFLYLRNVAAVSTVLVLFSLSPPFHFVRMLASSSGFQLEPCQGSWKEFHLLFLLDTFLKCNGCVKLLISLQSWLLCSITAIMLHAASKTFLLCFLPGRRKGTFRGKIFSSCLFLCIALHYFIVYCSPAMAKLPNWWGKYTLCLCITFIGENLVQLLVNWKVFS